MLLAALLLEALRHALARRFGGLVVLLLFFLGRVLSHLPRHDQLTAFFHHRLRVVALLETLLRLHDAALGIAEIALRLRLWLTELPREFRTAAQHIPLVGYL